jgi:hypothetical protein
LIISYQLSVSDPFHAPFFPIRSFSPTHEIQPSDIGDFNLLLNPLFASTKKPIKKNNHTNSERMNERFQIQRVGMEDVDEIVEM